MHLFLIISALLGLSGLGYAIFIISHADTFPTFPTFSPKIKWDISKKDSRISRAFSIPSNRSYTYAFFLTFGITDSERNISGVPSQLTDIVGRMPDSGGIAIPLHIKVEMLDVNKIGQEGTILDETASTNGSRRYRNRAIDLEIASKRLVPGRYIVTATTTEETSLPVWIETYSSIGLSGSSK